MTVLTFPDACALQLAAYSLGQQRFDYTEQSDGNGHTATRVGAPPRWRVSLRSVPALLQADAARWKALQLGLRGRINHLALWDVTNPQPRGTARGAITTGSALSAGAISAALEGARGVNLTLFGGMDIDSNADGISNGWISYTAGTTSGVAFSRPGGPDGFAQRVAATSIGGTSSSAAGIALAARQAITAGQVYTISADILGFNSTQRIECAFYNSGGGLVGSVSFADWLGAGLGYDRRSITVTAPAGAVDVQLWIYMHSGTGASPEIRIDRVLIAEGTTTTWVLPTLLAGDWLQIGSGVGSHYCMLTADATANGAGQITVSFEPPTRAAIGGGTAVIWDKPVCHFKQMADAVAWDAVPGGTDVGGFAMELIEDWNA
ncbi:hypothetical protein [Pseudaquabacterium pictum]|uniref:CBM-cenC domain-containing protein n=1 Tax=Pseudaquabacterium pictum TaxID=2315236 RepID=A0A480AM69_9BURK|nr:hypothetical protein [Rubrivivax pictus]GCL61487.1 hypothetical protein AQPW35_05680 [Rubrivivax pictus]